MYVRTKCLEVEERVTKARRVEGKRKEEKCEVFLRRAKFLEKAIKGMKTAFKELTEKGATNFEDSDYGNQAEVE